MMFCMVGGNREEPALEALWAKSDAGGHPHSLIGHLLDTASVGELIWDDYMSPGFRGRLDAACAARGRDVFRLVCGLHDVGKATPAFQRKVPSLCVIAEENGHQFSRVSGGSERSWFHGPAGARIIDETLTHAGASHLAWILPLIEGHHGRFGDLARRPPRGAHGQRTGWGPVQQRLARRMLELLGIDLAALRTRTPPRAVQLGMAGFVVMADWIASSSYFPGLGLREVALDEARARAKAAWEALAFHHGWSPARLHAGQHLYQQRFGAEPRPVQSAVIDAARSLAKPGMLIVEAPMGEGKTEAAFSAAEILAKSFGCNGFALALPTQGTTDAMYLRARSWAHRVDPDLPVVLLHGKRLLNAAWVAVTQRATVGGVHDDEFGMSDQYGSSTAQPNQHDGPSEWLVGRHRGLLAPGVVGTIDQLLYAATRTKYVMLRHAGLAGKVVIIDEVHSYDVYMSIFLHELLRWCGAGDVPVVLLSATLPPDMREQLVSAYTGKAPQAPGERGYPLVTAVQRDSPPTTLLARAWRSGYPLDVEVLPASDDDVEHIADRIRPFVEDGGCALTIMNAVGRAQRLYRLLADRGLPVVLIHGRLTTAERAARTEDVLEQLGPSRTRLTGRPSRLIVVATQIAEQSFDVDADILFTDLAPMDLLLQRAGRVHRHDRPAADRPPGLRRPRMVVTGSVIDVARPPTYPAAFSYVYGDRPLLAAAAVMADSGRVWTLPDEIAALVARAYAHDLTVPPAWAEVWAQAREEDQAQARARQEVAKTFRLTPEHGFIPDTLEGLHYLDAGDAPDEAAVVRDGEPTREICLVRHNGRGYVSLSGRPLGANGEACTTPDVARMVLGDTVRVRQSEDLGELRPLPGWSSANLLRHQDVLVLDESGSARAGPTLVRYDDELGLLIERKRR